MRDLLKANEVLHEIKQHEDISRTHRSVRCKSGRCRSVRLSFRSVLSVAARGKFNVFECASHTITRVCHSSMAAETRGLGLQVDSMQFFADLLSEILEVSAPSSKNLPLKQNGIAWPEMIATKALTLEIATIREWLVKSGALIRWTADENVITNGLTKDHKNTQGSTWLGYSTTANGVYKETPR